MSNPFFEKPVLNSPYEPPARHWELDEQGQPTQRILDIRRRAEFITPIPKPKKRKSSAAQTALIFDEGRGLSTGEQQYDPTSIITRCAATWGPGAPCPTPVSGRSPRRPLAFSSTGATTRSAV
jgi:hypothetical protein